MTDPRDEKADEVSTERAALPILWVLVGLLASAFVAGRLLRENLGIEFSATAIHAWVNAFGWSSPACFVGLVTFRQFLLLPSAILLTVGGLCFGVLVGTALGATGILLSGLMNFVLARSMGRKWVQARYGRKLERLERRIESAGPFLVWVATAHPIGPMSPTHWAAGFSSVPLYGFVLAVLIGGCLRAVGYSFFGSTWLDQDSSRFYLAGGLLVAAIVTPFAHPGLRRRVFGIGEQPDL